MPAADFLSVVVRLEERKRERGAKQLCIMAMNIKIKEWRRRGGKEGLCWKEKHKYVGVTPPFFHQCVSEYYATRASEENATRSFSQCLAF